MKSNTTLTADTRLDATIDAFESEYCAGRTPAIGEHLPAKGDVDFQEILLELVRVDIEHRWHLQIQRSIDSYLEEFPELNSSPLKPLVAFEEYRLRLESGEHVERSEYERRYSIITTDWPELVSATDPSVDTLSTRLVSTDFDSLPDAIDTFPGIGDVVSGFRLVRQIGKGKFGRVFLAEQNSLAARLVVVKITINRTAEPQRLAQLVHTNIVPIHSEHQVDNLQVLCMPYLGETTLADVIRANRFSDLRAATGTAISASIRSGKNSESRELERLQELSYVQACLHWTRQIADGLRHAHEHGILHKDLKPANVLITHDGRPLLLDFNLSEQIVPGGVVGLLAGGTIPYMSPEQIRSLDESETLDERSDIFSFGAVLYEMLTGTMPFSDGTSNAGLESLLAERMTKLAEPRTLNSSVPPSISDMVMKCLRPSPEDRYNDVNEIVADLDRHFDNQSLAHTPNRSTAEKISKWTRRHPRLGSRASIAFLAAMLLITVIASALIYKKQSRLVDAREGLHAIASEIPELRIAVGSADTAVSTIHNTKQRLVSIASDLGMDGNSQRQAELIAVHSDQYQQLVRETLSLSSHAARRLARHESDLTKQREFEQEADRYQEQLTAMSAPDGGQPNESSDQSHADELVMRHLLNGNYDRAIPLLESMRREDSQKFTTWFHLGESYFAVGRNYDAEACFTTCSILWPDSPKTFLYRGITYLQMKEFKKAISDFNRALELRPDWEHAIYNRALAHRGLGDFINTHNDLSWLIANGNATTRTFLLRARVRKRMGDVEGAEDDRILGMSSNPTDYRDYVSRGVALMNTDSEAAIRDFTSALRLNPASRKAFRNMIYVYSEKQGNEPAALKVLDRMIDKLGPTPDDIMSRAVLHARLGDAMLAEADVTTALEMRDDAKLRFQAACAFALVSPNDAPSKDVAFEHLNRSIVMDVTWVARIADVDLKSLRTDRRYSKLRKLRELLPN